MKKPFLFTPGPTPLPDAVLTALARPIINHRSQDFKDVVSDVRSKLKRLWQTKHEVLILTASGSGAMEGAIVSTLKKSDRVLAVNGGKFGERWVKLAQAHGVQCDELKIEWGSAPTLDQIKNQLTPNHAALLIQSSETSTGTQYPIEAIGQWMKAERPKTLLIVDGITSVAATPISTDLWGIDILISGSQKALMLPPGLAFASISEKALERMKTSDLPKFYFDFLREHKNILENQTAYTPAISLVVALKESLTMIFNEGVESVYRRHDLLARATRASIEAMGLKLASRSPSVACTAAFLPESIDGKSLLKLIRTDYGFTIAGGQDQWEGKAFRLSHLGYYSPFDLLNAITALGRALEKEGYQAELSRALQVFMDTYHL